MRWGKLVWAAIGFTAAVFLAEYALPVPGLPYLAAALALACPLALLLKKPARRPALTLLLCAAAGLLAWWGRYELHVAPCEALAGQDVTVTARVTDYPVVNSEYSRISATVTGGAPEERAYLYLYRGELPSLRPGDIITAKVRVTSVMTRGADRSHIQTAAGRCLTGYLQEPPQVVGRAAYAWVYFPLEISHFVGNACLRLFDGDAGIFMKALLTGDKEELYEDVSLYGDLRQAGMLHAVTVSGMHVFVLMFFLQLLLGRGRRTTLVCIPIMGVFVLMAGCGASIVRAAVMQASYMAAPLFHREGDRASGIAASLLFLLLVNPMAAGGVGFQLSYACILGFAVFLPRLERRIAARSRFRNNRAVDYVLASLACTASATVFSIPVSAYYFGTVSLFSPIANLLTLPVLEVCFGAGYVLCALGAVFPAGAAVLAHAVDWGVRWCLLVYRMIARIPFACLYTADPGAVALLILLYALLFCLLRRRDLLLADRAMVFAAVCCLGVSVLTLVSAVRLRLGRQEIAVLDVGQGQSVVLLDATAAVVVDCGGTGLENAGDVTADYLLAAGKRHVDALVLTHLHDDHINGVETLLYRLRVERIILPTEAEVEEDELAELLAAADRYGTEAVRLEGDAACGIGDLSLSLYQPQAGTAENERGIVLLASFPERSALIMGDAGESCELRMVERRLVPDVDVLVVGHHGSKAASNPIFLRAARPEYALISAGRNNSYGFPSEETTDRLTRCGAAVSCTAEDGDLTIDMRTDG